MIEQKRRGRRSKAQIEADRVAQVEADNNLKSNSNVENKDISSVNEEKNNYSRENNRENRLDIRQKPQKPLKLDVSSVQDELQTRLGKAVKLKWVRHNTVSYHQEIGWQVVSSSMKTQVNKYSPDGRRLDKSENIQSDDGGAFTAEVGSGEFNFLMYKDLELYEQQDAVWNKEEADRPMDAIQNSSEMGERAGLIGDVKNYQPRQDVKINKQRGAY